ncbi:MAG: TonB-dependent receptor plug domain-containing protein [Sulfuritalea sp.]|nr:TonB-dependent receptor plug domain-containing protein [Sulfuritalea sp.]
MQTHLLNPRRHIDLSSLAVLGLVLAPCINIPAIAAEALSPITVSGAVVRPDLAPQSSQNPFRIAESSSSHTQTITREEIEDLRPRDVFELLNNATGVIATQGSRKGFSGLSVRGDSNFRWIVDGAYLQPNMAGRIMRSIPVMAIEEVTIVRGASALTMGPMTGSASPGGAPVDGFVIVRTRKPGKDGGQARLALESFDTVQAGVWAGKMLGDVNTKGYIAGMVNYADTNGPKEKLNNGASYNLWSSTGAGLLKAGLDTSGWLVDFMVYKDDSEFGIPNANLHFGPTGNPPAFGTSGDWRIDPSKTDVYVVSGNRQWGGGHTTLFSLSASSSHQVLTTTTLNLNDNKNLHLNLRHNIDFGKSRAVLGIDYQHWNNPSGMNYFENIPREEKTKGWFAQFEHKLFDGRLALDASLRKDTVTVVRGLDYYTAGAQPPGGTASPLIYRDRKLPAATFFSTGAGFRLTDQWKMTARYGANKQVSNNLNPMPGVVLGDDEQKKWELGLEGQFSRGFNPSFNYFHRAVKNEKSVKGFTYTSATAATVTCRSTVATTGAAATRWNGTSDITECYGQDDTVRGGLELTINGAFAERSSYRLGVTDFLNRTNVVQTTPKTVADLSVTHGFGAYTLTSAVKYVTAYKGSSTDAGLYLGGYTRLDLGLGYDWKFGSTPIRSSIFGRNLTDKKYETSNGVQDVGRVLGVEFLVGF